MSGETQPGGIVQEATTAVGTLSPEELERFILEEGPLSAGEVAALAAGLRGAYIRSQLRRLERLGFEEFRRQVRKCSGRAPEAARPRVIDDRPLQIFLDFHAQHYLAGGPR